MDRICIAPSVIDGTHVIMNKEAVTSRDVPLEASDLGRRMKLSKPHHSRYKLSGGWALYHDCMITQSLLKRSDRPSERELAYVIQPCCGDKQ